MYVIEQMLQGTKKVGSESSVHPEMIYFKEKSDLLNLPPSHAYST